MHCMAQLHEEPVHWSCFCLYRLIWEQLSWIFCSWIDFHVFCCNLVNTLIHFPSPLLVCCMGLTWLGSVKGGGLKHTTSFWWYSSVTLSAQQTTQLECWPFENWEMQVQLLVASRTRRRGRTGGGRTASEKKGSWQSIRCILRMKNAFLKVHKYFAQDNVTLYTRWERRGHQC